MRDLLLAAIVFGSLPFIFRHPYIGVLMWSWLAYMSPHRLTWGFAYVFPWSQVVGVALVASVIMTRDRRAIPVTGLTLTWFVYVGWMCITTAFAIFPVGAMDQLDKVLKIQLTTFITVMLMHSRRKIELLIAVMTLSIAYYGAKGGRFTLLGGGAERVYGPAGSFIQDNNALAVAVLMILPFLIYIYSQYQYRWARPVKLVLLAIAALCLLSAAGSQSRGAFLGCGAMAVYMWFQSRNKLISGIVIVAVAAGVLTFMPESWHDRMGTIETYEEDTSAMGRINAWYYAVNVANSRLTGAGFNSFSRKTFARWAPTPESVHAAHSIYFGTLADHGWIGLFLWLLILFLTWRNTSWMLKATKGREDLQWIYRLMMAIRLSFVGYMSASAFQSLQYFDLPWHIIGITVLCRRMVEERLDGTDREDVVDVSSQKSVGSDAAARLR